MIKMAICDDDTRILDKAETLVQAFNRTHKEEVNYSVEKYSSPQTLCDDVLEGKIFDVFLLDMEMPEMSGVSLAGKIREQIPSCVIIFLSSHTEFQYTQEGYKVQALRYVSKLIMETVLTEALEAAIQAHQKGEDSYYTLSHYSDIVRIPLGEILYVHRVKRMAVIVTEKRGEFQIKRPLRDIYAELNDLRFVFVDRSCFVNLNQIMSLAENEVTLKNGEKLPVSRKMLPVVKSTILKLWGGVK